MTSQICRRRGQSHGVWTPKWFRRRRGAAAAGGPFVCGAPASDQLVSTAWWAVRSRARGAMDLGREQTGRNRSRGWCCRGRRRCSCAVLGQGLARPRRTVDQLDPVRGQARRQHWNRNDDPLAQPGHAHERRTIRGSPGVRPSDVERTPGRGRLVQTADEVVDDALVTAMEAGTGT